MTVTYDFHDRTAIVTGGAKGIGRAIAKGLRDCGATVHVWDLQVPDIPGVSGSIVDVTKSGSIAQGVSAIPGTVDILVNNAGFIGAAASVVDSDPTEWRRNIEVNLVSIFEVCRHVVPLMKRSAHGRIINMASIAGKEGTPFLSAYSAAKAGVIAFTKSLGKELATSSIRVNAIAPAAVDTDLLWQLPPEAVRSMVDKSPMRRLGTVDEVAALALWLCSADCSFSTGAVFDLSGGRAAY